MLRRPQTGEEAAFSAQITGRSPFFPLVGDRLYAASTRLIDVGRGRRFALTVARSTPDSWATAVDYERCVALRHRELRRLLAGSQASVRQRALTIDAEYPPRPLPTPPDAIGLAAVDESQLRTGGPLAARWFFEDGLWGLGPSGDGSAVFGLVPDGVATVRAEFGEQRAQARVRENVFFIATSLPLERTVPERLVWLDGDGAAIRIVATETSRLTSPEAEPPVVCRDLGGGPAQRVAGGDGRPRGGDARHLVAPRGGGAARAARRRGDLRGAGKTTGTPLLYPWANRLSATRFEVAGKDGRRLARAPRRVGVADARLARGAARVDGRGGRARPGRRHPDWDAPAFPFRHSLRVEHQLTDSALITTTEVLGDPPVAFGWHPFLQLPGEPRAEWRVRLGAATRLELDDRMLPTGRRSPRERGVEPLGDRGYDEALADVDGPFVLEGAAGGSRSASSRAPRTRTSSRRPPRTWSRSSRWPRPATRSSRATACGRALADALQHRGDIARRARNTA